MGIKGLDHVNINTSNMKDTLSFNVDLLDFTDGFRPPFDSVSYTHLRAHETDS